MNERRKRKLRAWARVFLCALGLQYLTLLLCHVVMTGGLDFSTAWQTILRRLTTPGDAERYLDLARNGYTATGENAINLVFFPLYPLLIRLFGAVVGHLPAALLISQSCFAAAAVVLYELLLLDGDEQHAWDGVLLLTLYPFSVFAMGIFTEGLFLLLSISCLYALRSRRFLWAGCIGFLAALTRIQGVLLLLPAIVEICVLSKGKDKRAPRISDAGILLIPAGFLVYLLLNYLLHGNWTQFLVYEAGEPWYQTSRWIGENIATQYAMALEYSGLDWIIYWPQIALYFCALGILLWGVWKRHRIGDLVYGGAYLGATYLSGWMISGGRYLLCCVPLWILLAQIKGEWPRRLLLTVFAGLHVAYTLFYLMGFAIM